MSPTTGTGAPFLPATPPARKPAPAQVFAPEPPYFVTFYERDAPHKRFTVRLGEGTPTPATAGSGGTAGDWDVVTLPKRSAVTVWRGRMNLISMDVPIMLGDFDGGPLHPASTPLMDMWRPPNPTVEPPVIKIRSPGSAVPLQQLDYTVATLAWGDAQGGPNGNRLIQKMTVTLLEYRKDEVLQQQKAAKPKHRGKSYTVKQGDTLTTIAKRLKVKGGWRAIGDAQHPPIHDPRKIKVGQRLLIP